MSGQKLSPGYCSDDDRNAQTIMAFDSSSDDEEGMNNDGFIGSKFGRNSPIYDGRLSPEGSSLGTIDGEMDSSHEESDIDESEDEEAKAKASQRHSKRRDSARTTGSVTSAEDKLSLSDIVPYDTEEGSTVWLGTEDGRYSHLTMNNLRRSMDAPSHYLFVLAVYLCIQHSMLIRKRTR